MEFDKSRCYSALNADELRAGDKVMKLVVRVLELAETNIWMVEE